jgi:hypothetical protein
MLNTVALVSALFCNQLDVFETDAAPLRADATEVVWQPVQELVATFLKASFIAPDGRATEPVPFVCVCAVIDYSKQVDAVVAALKVDKAWATTTLDVIDFSIQRQELPTSGQLLNDVRIQPKWETLSMEPAVTFLTSLKPTTADPISDFHNDHIPEAVQAIAKSVTMPLPQKAQGTWGSEVTHHSLNQESPAILFRFLDTQVDEGRTYRYRVQLEFMNPSRSLEAGRESAADPFLQLGQTRLSPWSQASRSVVCTNNGLSGR